MSKVKSADQIDILETNHPDELNRFEQSTNVGGTKSKVSSKKRTSRSGSSDRETDLESLRSVEARQDRRSRMSRSRSRSRGSRSRSLARPLSAVRPLSGAEESENDEPKYKRSVGYRDNLHRMIRPIGLMLDKAQPKDKSDNKHFQSDHS